jgi:septum formation protein
MSESLILASASPQRTALLKGLGLVHRVVIPRELNESDHPQSDPARRAVELARLKVECIQMNYPRSWIIGCDTLVVSPDGKLFEKPRDRQEAKRMIEAQSGRTSTVHSGLCLSAPTEMIVDGLSSSAVHFKQLKYEDVQWWLSTKLWDGRSGAFQIDGPGQLLIDRIEGDWTSIVGLPIFLLGELSARVGLDLLGRIHR